jgi:chemotaxis protein CheD
MTVSKITIAKRYFITDSQFIITTVPANIHTVLGSCVSVCLWDKSLKMGGMNHYLMPGSSSSAAGNANHGYTSIPILINSMIRRGALVENLEAKIFGGCNSWMNGSGLFNIGFKNIEIADQILTREGIQITARNTGGIHGRKIIFNTFTGKVKVYLLTKTATVVNEEINKGFGY